MSQAGGHGLQCQLNLPDVLGCRAATATDETDSKSHEAPRVRGHVIGRAQVEIAALDVARLARVGLGCEWRGDDLRDPLDRLEHRRRTHAAVETHYVRAARDQDRCELLRRDAVQAVPVFLRGHLRHDGQVGDRANGGDRGADFVEIPEGLEHEQIDAAGLQRLGLFAKQGLGFIDAGPAPWLHADAERPDGAGDVRRRRTIHRVANVSREACRRLVQLGDAVAEPEGAQLHPIGAERVGLDDVGAGAQVLAMHVAHHVGIAQAERLETAVDEHALAIQHGPHRAVADEHAVGQGGEEGLQHGDRITRQGPIRR